MRKFIRTETWWPRRSSGGGSVRDQTLVWRVAASSSGSPARALHESLTGTSFAVAHFARMMPLLFLGHDWTANERAEIRRLEKFCEASDSPLSGIARPAARVSRRLR